MGIVVHFYIFSLINVRFVVQDVIKAGGTDYT